MEALKFCLLLCITVLIQFICIHGSVHDDNLNVGYHDSAKAVEAIRERIKRQTSSTRCDLADIVFSLDSSGSIGADNWLLVLNFTKSVAAGFDIGTDTVQIGVNFYGNQAHLAFNLNRYNNTEDVLQAIDNITWLNENTNTSGGIRLMYRDMFTTENGARPGVPAIGIVITDGVSTYDANLTIPEAVRAKEQQGIKMFAIGITDAVQQSELIGIASSPESDFVFNADDFNSLDFIRQQVVTAACQAASDCSNNPDLVILLDASGSIRRSDFDLVLLFLEAIIMDTNIDNDLARIGLLIFSTDVSVEFQLNTYQTREEMINHVRGLRYRGGTTNVAEALRVARTQMFTAVNGSRSEAHNVALLLGDGGSNDLESVLTQARVTRLDDITIIAAAVGDWIDMNELNEIASDPDSENVIAADFEFLNDLLTPLKRAVCNDRDECLLQQPCQNGGTCVNLINRYICQCPVGFAGPQCQYSCTPESDIVILLDASSSMGETEWFRIQEYSKFLISHFNINSNQMRVGVLTYANQVDVRINLNDYTNMSDIINAMSWPFSNGATNTQEALRVMRSTMFTQANGNRQGVQKIGILITDGHSSDRLTTFQQAALAHADDIRLLGLGVRVRSTYDREEMSGITSDPDINNYIEVSDTQSLYDMTTQIINLVCNSVNECSSSPCRNGGTCVDKLNMYECQCPAGFTGMFCERECDGALDIGVVIDVSGSILQERFPLVKNFVRNILNQLEIRPGRVQVGVVTFSDAATLRFPFTTYAMKEDVLHAIDTLSYTRGRTNTADALRMVREQLLVAAQGDRELVPDVLLVFTDGQSNVNGDQTVPRAIEARIAGIHIIVVSVETNRNNFELKGMASDPDSFNLFSVERYGDLPSIVNNIVSATCNDVDECASSPCQNNGQCADGMGQYVCQCPADFTGERCERACSAQVDIAFILDGTGSMEMNFTVPQLLTKLIVQGLNFANDRTRVSVVTFQNTDNLQFSLNAYTRKEDVLNAIAFVNDVNIYGTNTAAALLTVRNDIFSAANGDRSGVPNLAVLMTDGESNINSGNTLNFATAARNVDIRLMAIGLGPGISMSELNGIGNTPSSSNVFTLNDISQLQNTANRVLDEICQL